jgi:subtilisin
MSLRALLDTTAAELATRADLRPIEVAVLDSGIDATHPSLHDRVAAAVRIDLVEGKPVVVESSAPANADLFGHGTAVAAMVLNAPNVRVVDVRVLGPGNTGGGAALLAGLSWAIERGVPIINMSLAAKAEFGPRLAELCERAHRRNQVIVAAKRNVPLTDLGFPAELSQVISVDALATDDPWRVRFLSDPPIELAARGEDLMVPAAGGGFTRKTGASFATPHVAAMCALIRGAYPDLRPYELKSVLRAWGELA